MQEFTYTIKDEIGIVFSRVLEDAGVFKRDKKGQAAFVKFIVPYVARSWFNTICEHFFCKRKIVYNTAIIIVPLVAFFMQIRVTCRIG